MKRLGGRTPIERLLRPIEEFAAIQSSSGLVLLACAVAGMAWANSSWWHGYVELLHTDPGRSAAAWTLANAGVRLVDGGGAFQHPHVIAGIALGLVIGKPLGIVALSWLAIRTGAAERPPGTTWLQLVGVACLGGIGFTMALFIAALAFEPPALLAAAKVGVLGASLVAALAGTAVLLAAARRDPSGERQEPHHGRKGSAD